MSSLTTRMPNGVTNAQLGTAMSNSSIPDPSFSHLFFDDFTEYTAANWTVTNTGVTPTNALTSEDGGVLLNTTTTGANDLTYLQKPTASFNFVAGKTAIFKAHIKMGDATACAVHAGMIETSTTPVTSQNGVFFYKAAAGTTWVLRTISGGTTVDLALPSGLVSADATYVELGFRFTGSDLMAYFNAPVGSQVFDSTKNNRGHVALLSGLTLPAALTTPSFGIKNGAAAAKTLSVDYILASFER